MRARFLLLVVVGMALGLSSAWAGPADVFEGFAGYVDHCLAAGDRAEVERIVTALETHPVPASPSRTELLEALVGVLTARGEESLARRVHDLPVLRRSGRPARPTPLAFPGDDGVHPDAFAEWWYFNGILQGANRRYGYELTFFRTAVGVHFVHAALSDVAAQRHPYVRRYVRPWKAIHGKDRLGVVYDGGFTARDDGKGNYEVAFTVGGERLQLSLRPLRDPMIVNGDGVIDMPEGGLSRYYSFTRLAASGTLVGPGGRKEALRGQSWYDHQWGNFVVLFRPWDWFCFQMEDGSEYNVFGFRQGLGFGGRACVNRLGPTGALTVSRQLELARHAWWRSPRTGDSFVTSWTVALPEMKERFAVTTPVPDQEMPRTGPLDIPPPYWEGLIEVVRQNADGSTTRGVGYSEHMPYRSPRRRHARR